MRLSKLIQAVQGELVYENGEWEREILSLSTDGRKEQPSSLFFCLSGGERDAHAFAGQALKAGAVAVVCERRLPLDVPQFLVRDARLALGLLSSVFYGEPSKSLRVIGVTGTNGKTTVSYMLENICKECGKKVGVIGTLGIRYDGIEEANDLTTPDPAPLQRTLANMRKSGVEYVVMEVSAHALYYHKTAGVKFACCVFTNCTQDHLDFFRNMQAYSQAKLSLFDREVCPIAVVNGDEEFGVEIARRRAAWGGKTLTYGLHSSADSLATLTDESVYGTACALRLGEKQCKATLSMAGRHNVYNALAAATCAEALGMPVEAIARGLTSLSKVSGRLERVPLSEDKCVFVDFAHTPDGLQNSLQALKKHCVGKLVCLFGCGGNRDKSKRPLMGEIAAKESDFSVLTSDNPRYEEPLDILRQIERGYRRFSTRYVVVPDRRRAIAYALAMLQKGDILLIAGKGGERAQEIMGIKYPFSDQDVVKALFAEECRSK